ncbi:MAG: methylisocitrate lyase, partial [Geobacteraceae bacterium]
AKASGADAIFPEALTTAEMFRTFAREIDAPLLANMTEFGVTPLFGREELAAAGVSLILYPLSAFRAMSGAALRVYRAIRQEGSQRSVIDIMQSRVELRVKFEE